MPSWTSLAGFALIVLGMVCTPGPNMAYLLSRSVTQGRRAGMISLAGLGAGFVVYMLCAVGGLATLLLALPLAFGAVQWCGAGYLLWLAWNAVKPGARGVFEARPDLPFDLPRRLFAMGMLTALLNPKIAVLYLTLLPQFIDPARDYILLQGLVLGLLQITVSLSVNALIVLASGTLARRLATRPGWLRIQRWVMGCVLAALALRLAVQRQGA